MLFHRERRNTLSTILEGISQIFIFFDFSLFIPRFAAALGIRAEL
jgi:hypothetical protein